MTRPTLPNETLIEIFSHLSSSKPALYNVSLSSQTFLQLAKPFLYNHVIIGDNEDHRKLMRVRKEDAKLVKKLTINGCLVGFEGSYLQLGTQCVRDLFMGNLLDISGSFFSLFERQGH